jgi:hypothetical protein
MHLCLVNKKNKTIKYLSNMKKIIAALAITAMFASCKKERVTNPAPGADKKLSQMTYAYDGQAPENETITYDAKGRILTYTTEDHVTSFLYENDTRLIVTIRKKSDNSITGVDECTLNSKGAITEILFKTPAGVHNYTYEFIYNGDNQMINLKGISPGGSSYENKAVIVNGNVQSVERYSDGLPNGTIVYTYEGAKPNKLPVNLSSYWPSQTLFGKSNAHLQTECKMTNAAGTVTWHSTSMYQLDTDGYVTKANWNYIHDGTAGSGTYQYQ